MLQAAEELASIIGRGRAAYDNDIALRRAVERCVEIFGEAAKSVTPELRGKYSQIPWNDMARLRDRLSHHYHRIDPDLLWTIAIDSVPAAANQIRAIPLDGP